MADAKALFKRHMGDFVERNWTKNSGVEIPEDEWRESAVIIYAACIIAEAIKNSLDETQ